MKKILSTFLLSAMLVLVFGGCEGDAGVKGKQGIQGEQAYAGVNEIDRLELKVEALTNEVTWLHACARREMSHSTWYDASMGKYSVDHPDHGRCGGSYEPKSPYRSKEAFDAYFLFP